jgi:hypothetical protein
MGENPESTRGESVITTVLATTIGCLNRLTMKTAGNSTEQTKKVF